jgi:hypothetical protein
VYCKYHVPPSKSVAAALSNRIRLIFDLIPGVSSSRICTKDRTSNWVAIVAVLPLLVPEIIESNLVFTPSTFPEDTWLLDLNPILGNRDGNWKENDLLLYSDVLDRLASVDGLQ